MILALLRIIFIVVVLSAIFVVVRFFQYLGRPRARDRNEESIQGTMVKDEFCNMYVPQNESFREVYEGKEYYFCSKECRDKFLAAKRNAP